MDNLARVAIVLNVDAGRVLPLDGGSNAVKITKATAMATKIARNIRARLCRRRRSSNRNGTHAKTPELNTATT
ncbi:MAG: hypothetical protein ACRD0P_28505 [Stackebrandtia sp.]